MKTIKFQVEDAVFAELSKRRQKAGLPTIPAYLLEEVGLLSDDLHAAEIVKKAKARAMSEKWPVGREFSLRDLFQKTEWEGYRKPARLRAGRIFFDDIAEARHGLRPTKKGPSGHQLYVKGRVKTR